MSKIFYFSGGSTVECLWIMLQTRHRLLGFPLRARRQDQLSANWPLGRELVVERCFFFFSNEGFQMQSVVGI